jgi:hypothetical protein
MGMGASEPSASLRRDMEEKGIDVEMSLSILEDYNSGLYDGVKPVKATGVPAVDGKTVVAIDDSTEYAMGADEAARKLAELGLPLPRGARREGAGMVFGRAALAEIGERLFPRTAYGVLNGGSATSYADRKKNLAFGEEVFSLLEKGFDALAPLCKDRPKGVTPAYMNPDGSLGESFLLLKARARLVAASSYIAKYGPISGPFLPLFQMSSAGNDAELRDAYSRYAASPLLAPLAARTGLEAARFETGVQPLISAYTHSSEGRPKRIFDRAHGRADSAIALPGGHGQCFRVLAPVFKKLRDSGIRFAYLGNVDNLGYVPDPVEVALLALSGRPAAFDFSKRTSVDVKGGILVETAEGRTVADIGPAISFDEVRRLEASGASILFNCAIGLFDLDWLVPRLDEIARGLPLRVSDQDKDAGKYSQAEQVTWEVTGILPSFLAFAVSKYDRFIAAKLLAETLLTSGIAGSGGAGSGGAGSEAKLPQGLAETSLRLKEGLFKKLSDSYGLALRDGRWQAAF